MGKVFGAAGVVDEFEGLFGVHLCWFFFSLSKKRER